MPNPNAVLAEKNLRRKVAAWREALHELVLYFLPGEYGGSDLTDLGIMCGNTQGSLDKARAIARRSGFSSENPGFDVDGDGATTSFDVEAWLADPTRSPVPEITCWGEGGCSFNYGVTNGDRVQQEEFLRGELQRLRTMEADLLHEWVAGEFDKVRVADAVMQRTREDVSRLRTKEFLARGQRREGWPLVAAIAAIGAGPAGAVVMVGYAWQVLRGGWTEAGASDVDAGVQAAETSRARSLDRWPLVSDLRRLGDRWDPSRNCPDEAPIQEDGPSGLIERVRRWSRALVDPFTRWFFSGSLLAPFVHDSAVLTWWRRAIADIDGGRVRPGMPFNPRLTRLAPVPMFSDEEPKPRTVQLPTRVMSSPAAATPSAVGGSRVAAKPSLGTEVGPPGQRTFLGPDFEIRERVPAPIPGGTTVKAPPDHTLRIVDANGNFVRFVDAGGEGVVPPGGRAEVEPTAAEYAAMKGT